MIAYLVTNTINGKRYVGISKKSDPAGRWAQHLSQAKRSSNGKLKPYLLHKAIVLYGADVFTIEHIASAKNLADLHATERLLIAQYGTFWFAGGGYNMTRGGDGVDAPRTAEWKEKIRQAHLGKKMSPEACASMSAVRKGISLSKEHKANIKGALKGLAKSAEHNAKVAAALLGFKRGPQTEEHKNKARKANLGRAWITNGKTNKRILPDGSAMPEGWRLGRTGIVGHHHKPSPETVAKRAAALRGRKMSDESKERMRIAALLREARKRIAA